jgi:hypothetical protein
MEPIPTPRQELERKTVDFLQHAVHRAESNRLDRRELKAMGQALWTITSGLVDDDVTDLCARVSEVTGTAPMKRHFVGRGIVRTFAWQPDKPGYVILTRSAVTGEPIGEAGTLRRTEIGEREEELKRLFDTLCRSGYVEL